MVLEAIIFLDLIGFESLRGSESPFIHMWGDWCLPSVLFIYL